MRWNLALTYGLDAADEFLRLHRSLVSEPAGDQRHWDVVTVLDLAYDLDPNDWPPFDLARLERYLETVLARTAREARLSSLDTPVTPASMAAPDGLEPRRRPRA